MGHHPDECLHDGGADRRPGRVPLALHDRGPALRIAADAVGPEVARAAGTLDAGVTDPRQEGGRQVLELPRRQDQYVADARRLVG